MLLAGEDTTANSLAWLIYLLHKNPQALQRVQEEVRALAPDASDFSPDQMAQLVYLEACAHESMRLKPVAPTNVLEALNDTTIGDVAVPAGTLVWCVMRGDSVDDRYFPNATAFDPERWLNDPEDSGGASVNKRVSMPFGSGPRVCPGRYLALLEIKMAMALLLSRFDIVSVDTEDGGEAKEHMAFAMSPQALSMRLRERAA
jgi:cytochrome P450